MAEAREPSDEELDLKEIYNQWGDWCGSLWAFERTDKSGRENVLKELNENMPKRLIQLEDCTKMFLENRLIQLEDCTKILNIDDIYLMTVPAYKLLDSMEFVSANEEIELEQLDGIERLKEKLTGTNIYGYWMCTKLIQDFQRFSCRFKSLESEQVQSDEELLHILNEFESLESEQVQSDKKLLHILNESWSDLVVRTKITNERCKEERWLGTLLLLYKRMIKDAQLLKTRVCDTLHALESKPSLFGCLTGMKSSLEDVIKGILESDSKVILDPGTEYSHVCSENPDVVVTFSSETVQSSQEIHIALKEVSVEEGKLSLTEVAGYSSVIEIQHDEEFQKPVTVTTPMVLIGDCDISSCDLFCVHMDDSKLTIQVDVKVEVLNGNLCQFATSTFNSNVLHARRRNKGNQENNWKVFLKEVQTIHGASPHNILVFIGAGSDNNSWKLHTEVVDEDHVEDIINRRKHERSVFELPRCRSQSLLMRGIKQIEVDLGDKGALDMYRGSSQQQPVINIVHGGKANFISFPVTRKDSKTMAIVNFKAVGRKDLLYRTDFNAEEFDRFQYQAKVQTDAPGNTSGTKKTISGTSKPVLSEFFGDESMLCLTKQISADEMYDVAIYLKISHVMYQDCKSRYPNEFKMILFKHWLKRQTCSGEEMLSTLRRALNNANLKGMAQVVASVYRDNRALENADFPN